jgi:hypothetical protein
MHALAKQLEKNIHAVKQLALTYIIPQTTVQDRAHGGAAWNGAPVHLWKLPP